MERNVFKNMLEWKEKENRKPLLLRGARQIGKTWAMKEFGRRFFAHTAYINFDKQRSLAQIFEADFDVARIIMALNAETKIPIEKQTTLIIFDEIQEAPKAISALKYFCEDAPEYAVMAAGSLLGVAIHEGISFPVGKIDTLNMHPLSFTEFLQAMDEASLADLLRAKDWSLISAFSEKYKHWLKNYYYIGGMPEVVADFAANHDYARARAIQNDILVLYEQDFGKHISGNELERTRMLWNSVPVQLAKENKKFFFGNIKKGARAKEFEIALQWLLDCALIHKVYRVSKPNMPLKSYAELNAYKLFSVDVGLLCAMSELDSSTVIDGNRIFVEFKGALTEQFVLQELKAATAYTPYYYASESAKYEIDFMLQIAGKVYPVEVKAEENLKAKSLRVFSEKFQPPHAIRLSAKNYIDQGWVVNVPLYAVCTL